MTAPLPPDQRDLWIAAYASQRPGDRSDARSTLLDDAIALLAPRSRVLELGCGAGEAAETLARAGHIVTATDFVPELLAANRARTAGLPNLTFQEMRIDAPYPFPGGAFDAVYAHLTLHYFKDDITRDIVAEIHRILRPGGWLIVACKSPQDPSWGKGVQIEPDMFDYHGKVRHFISEDYARILLADDFTDIRISSHTGKLYRQKAGWISVIAKSTQDLS